MSDLEIVLTVRGQPRRRLRLYTLASKLEGSEWVAEVEGSGQFSLSAVWFLVGLRGSEVGLDRFRLPRVGMDRPEGVEVWAN